MTNKPSEIFEQDQWEAKGAELFGDDKVNWRFVCPQCGNVASIEKAKRLWPDLKGRNWAPHQECIGRYLDDIGCDWAAYGLFRGPIFVRMADKAELIPVFRFEGG